MRKDLLFVASLLVISTACADSAAPPAESSSTPAATNAPAAAGAPAAAPAPRQPRFREVTVPAGTPLSLTLDTAVASDASKLADAVHATLANPLVVNGTTVLPAGTEAMGSVVEVEQSGRVKGRAVLAIAFDRLQSGRDSYTIAARIRREAEATKGEDAAKIGIGAAAGAIVGALADGKKGAAVGSAVGAGAGTGVVLATRGDEVSLAAGTVIETTLEQPLKVQVPVQ
jgi:type IV secretory pathway VirB10-like protein